MIKLDDDRKLVITNIEIVKRTFEGINDDPLRSKYYPSRKYAVKYDIENYEHNPVVKCVVGKKDAVAFVERLKQIHVVVS